MKFKDALRCACDILEKIALSIIFPFVAIYAALLFCVCKIFGISLEDEY